MSATATSAAYVGGVSDAVYGLLAVGELDVALPLSALREVVPYPSRPAALPVTARGLVGAIRLRSLVLPMVDLRQVLGDPGEPSADRVVVVVADAGRMVGLVVDEVCGVTRVPEHALFAVGAHDTRLLMSHAFQHGPDQGIVSVLDAGELLSLPGVPTVEEPAAAAPIGHHASTGSRLTVARAGSQRLALDVGDVHTTIPLTSLRSSMLTGGDCLGTVEYAGAEVPVLDPLRLLGLTALPVADVGAGLVVDLGTGLVVLAVSELVRLAECGEDDVHAIPGHASHHGHLVQGIVDLEDGSCLVLDGAALKSDSQLMAFAAVNTALDTEVGTGVGTGGDVVAAIVQSAHSAGVAAAAPAGGPAYVTYTAGVELATELSQVSEILPFPATLTPTSAAGVLGLMVHRGRAVPVSCLSDIVGRSATAPSATSCLLLVEDDGHQVAFVVDALGSIAPLGWSDPEAGARDAVVDLSRCLVESPLVQVAGVDHLFRDLDLRAIARALRGEGGGLAREDQTLMAEIEAA